MTVEQKVGQLVQADISTITPEDLADYPLGSILAGGNSGPDGNERAAAPPNGIALVASFRAASSKPAANGIAIPILFGVDAVHGHSNLPNATIFPHNIGLGATHDPDLIRRIGEATADEVSASGIEWTFAPTIAVPQDLRWGRSYEGYSSDPEAGRRLCQGDGRGPAGQARRRASRSPTTDVVATPKHFLADGGTFDGKDQGDARIGEAELIARHAPGYVTAIDAGALTVMVSFSSWNGVKNHGNRSLLTDVLKGRMGFDGLRRRRLERARPDSRLHGHRLRAPRSTPGSTCTWRPTAGRDSTTSLLRARPRRRDPEAPARRRGAPDPARQGQARPARRQRARTGSRPTRSAAPEHLRAGARSGREVARAAQERGLGAADQARREGARRRARRRQHRDAVGRLDGQLAGQRRHQRRFRQERPHGLRRDLGRGEGGGRHRDACRADGSFDAEARRRDRRLRREALRRIPGRHPDARLISRAMRPTWRCCAS